MKAAITIVQMVIRLAWLILFALGALIWTGRGQSLTSIHTAIGIAFVLALWLIAYLGTRSAAAPSLIGIVSLWGVIVLVLGLTQTGMMTGHSHSMIRVLHLLVGIVAIGLAEALGARIRPSFKG